MQLTGGKCNTGGSGFPFSFPVVCSQNRKILNAGKGEKKVDRLLILTFCISQIIKGILFPDFEPLPVTGEHIVETAEETWVDKDRLETYTDTGENRSVTIKIWYPKEEGSYPLVVFSHGAGGVLESNASTCENLASHGYVAVAIAHPYQAAYVRNVNGKITPIDATFMEQIMTGGNAETGNPGKTAESDRKTSEEEKERQFYERQMEWMTVRRGDMNFVLDTLLAKVSQSGKAPYDRIDTGKIGVFGHSLGGATAVAAGRERSDINAVIDIEGTMLAEYTGYEKGKHTFYEEPYPVPLLDINSRAVYEEAKGLAAEGEEYVNFYVGRQAADFREVIFEDAGHMNFCDLSLAAPILAGLLGTGTVDEWECLENLNELVLNYFDCYLKDQPLVIKDSY